MINPVRRSLITTLAGTALSGSSFSILAATVKSQCFTQDGDMCTEFQRGDPKGPVELVNFSRQKVRSNVQETKADYLPRIKDFGDALVEEASQFVGFNRANNRTQIEDMLELFGLSFSDSKGKPYAYCAAGLSYVAAKAYANSIGKTAYSDILQALGDVDHYHFFPNPGVANMVTVAQIHGRWVPASQVLSGKKTPKPGWLTVFKWTKKDHHIGILRSIDGEKLKTIEFNTSPEGVSGSQSNGGAVAERNRSLGKFVHGFIDTGILIRT